MASRRRTDGRTEDLFWIRRHKTMPGPQIPMSASMTTLGNPRKSAPTGLPPQPKNSALNACRDVTRNQATNAPRRAGCQSDGHPAANSTTPVAVSRPAAATAASNATTTATAHTPDRPTHTRSATAQKRRKERQKLRKKQKADDKATATHMKDVLKDTKLGRMLQHSFMQGRAAEKAVSKDRRANKRILKQTIQKQSKAGKRLAKRRRAAKKLLQQ